MTLVSVVVPVFNRAHVVGDAVGSLLRQTHAELEVVVVDDGSTDASVAVVEAFGDGRVRVVRHEANRGIPHARNTGLEAARGRYIAWLDSDDVARPTRIAEQLAFLKANPEVALVGACAGKLRADGRRKRGVRVPPTEHAVIAPWLLFRSAFQQSAVMARADVLRRFPYRPDLPVCEDLDQFQRIAAEHRVANLAAVLVDRRVHPDQTIRRRQDAIKAMKLKLAPPWLERLGMRFGSDDVARHVQLGNRKQASVPADADFLRWAEAWLHGLQAANAWTDAYDGQGLAVAGGWFWALACADAASTIGRGRALGRFAGSELARGLTGEAGRRWLRAALGVWRG
ncbi:glycosyltransferase family 2 protein [Sphingomonas lenta]|uniref:Glycosyltransferase 2-like domain-containing protein n=1 Tax=Sphingomonas lenta TaxID=1141887 RepID=A0A2A2SED4_9SPHN|nr:glycosyltransferase family A protein [Sphingomonas lenta]PAX07654.1 hypothetical protein CKY28_08385 [Sphingomonas lenta]